MKLPIEFIGMNIQDAFDYCKNNGIEFRVAMEDGKHKILTEDIRSKRINFTVVNKIITSVSLG